MRLNRRPPEDNSRLVVSFAGNRISFFINKNGSIIQTESWPERKWTWRLEHDPRVIKYSSQPEPYFFRDSRGRRRRYTPDYKVEWDDGRIEIYEITTRERRDTRETQLEREEAGRELCAQNGWVYIVLTEDMVPSETEVANLQALHPSSPEDCSNQAVTDVAFDYLEQHGQSRLCDLFDAISDQLELTYAEICDAVYHLMWHSRINTDLEILILDDALPSAEAIVWLED